MLKTDQCSQNRVSFQTKEARGKTDFGDVYLHSYIEWMTRCTVSEIDSNYDLESVHHMQEVFVYSHDYEWRNILGKLEYRCQFYRLPTYQAGTNGILLVEHFTPIRKTMMRKKIPRVLDDTKFLIFIIILQVRHAVPLISIT